MFSRYINARYKTDLPNHTLVYLLVGGHATCENGAQSFRHYDRVVLGLGVVSGRLDHARHLIRVKTRLTRSSG